ncbi:MAG: cyclic nucleotide-binding domain-containing protein [Chloroflexi bacterium]|nr:cyclic nucleotide-binding domain-containing protein [Chloroflexota bacterium]
MVPNEALRQYSLFKGVDDKELAKLAPLCHEKTYDAGAALFNQGNKASKLHLCKKGSVDIIVHLTEPWGIDVTVHKAKAGEIFGWSSLVEPHIYTASAKCSEKTEVIQIEASDLARLFEENPHLGYVVMANLSAVISSRLGEYRQKLAVEIASTIKKEW